MKNTVRIMVISEQEKMPAQIMELDRLNILQQLQKIVDGRIESANSRIRDTRLLCNDQGKLRNLRRNEMATLLYDSRADYIVGTAVLIGTGYDDDGEMIFDDLTAAQEAAAWKYFRREAEA